MATKSEDTVVKTHVKTMTSAEFATTFALRPNLFAWFLGAGASAASGIPTGYSMIRDFKTRIFCRETGYSIREVDATDPLWVARVDEFLRKSEMLPADGDPTEYAAAFEAVYPNERQRRQYIDDAIRKGNPSFAHRTLAALMSSKQLNCVFTTNFDNLIESSATVSDQLLPPPEQARPTLAALDSSERALRCFAESDWPLIAKLHGDYQSINIKNTTTELENQDKNMRGVLLEAGKRFGFVVVGYSGRDASIMEVLESALKHIPAYPNGLYWVASSKSKLLPAVQQLLERASQAGVDVAVVESKNFDELAGDLVKQIHLSDALLEHVLQRRAPPKLESVRLPVTEAQAFPVLRYSAILVESIPEYARRITLEKSVTTPIIRSLLKEKGCRALVAARGQELAVFGKDEDILKALASVGPKLNGTIKLSPGQDSWALGLIYDSLATALCRRRPIVPRLKRSGHSLVVARPRDGEEKEKAHRRDTQLASLLAAYGSKLTGTVSQLGCPYQEGVFLKLEYIENRWWCGFEPSTFVDLPRENFELAEGEYRPPLPGKGDPAGDWRRERWATKYNGHWAKIIDAWASLLTTCDGGAVFAYGLKNEEGIDAKFNLSTITAWSRPSHGHAYFERSK